MHLQLIYYKCLTLWSTLNVNCLHILSLMWVSTSYSQVRASFCLQMKLLNWLFFRSASHPSVVVVTFQPKFSTIIQQTYSWSMIIIKASIEEKLCLIFTQEYCWIWLCCEASWKSPQETSSKTPSHPWSRHCCYSGHVRTWVQWPVHWHRVPLLRSLFVKVMVRGATLNEGNEEVGSQKENCLCRCQRRRFGRSWFHLIFIKWKYFVLNARE